MRLSKLEYEQLLQRPSIRARNSGVIDPPALPAPVKKHHSRKPLEAPVQREAPGGERFEIVFTIHAFQPCDWDNYHVKELQDMAVAAGIIPSDSWDTLSGRVVCKKAETKEQERTEITICKLS